MTIDRPAEKAEPRPKPVVLLLHGAWHRPLHYLRLIDPLRGMGYTVVAPALPSGGWTDAVLGRTLADDVATAKQCIAPCLDAGRDVVVVCHSFGGLPATDSVVGETVVERAARGLPGGVKAVVYIAAFAAPKVGLTLMDMNGVKGESYPDWWDAKDGLAVTNNKARNILYSGVDDDTVDIFMASLVKASVAAFHSPVQHAAAEIAAPKIYIAAKNDQGIPFEVQMAMAEAAGAKVKVLDSGHSPFVMEEQTAQILEVLGEVLGEYDGLTAGAMVS